MYVDESGVEEENDETKYFVVSGVIFHENDLEELKQKITKLSWQEFPEKFRGNEIHIHDIFRGKKDFEKIDESEIKSLLTKIYELINSLEFSIISVAIDKPQLLDSRFSNWSVLETAYTFLVERFHNFLGNEESKGMVRIDMTSNKESSLNKKDKKIFNLIHNIRRDGTNWQSVKNIIEDPIFFDSKNSAGIQIAVVYCTNRLLSGKVGFEKYWKLLYPKIQTNHSGEIWGYGLTVFPKEDRRYKDRISTT